MNYQKQASDFCKKYNVNITIKESLNQAAPSGVITKNLCT